MTLPRILILIALILFGRPSLAELYLHTNLKCVSTLERREVHIYRDSAEPPVGPACRVDYMKQGVTSTLWTAQNDVQFCVDKANELATLLESSQFKCVATATFDTP